MAIRLRRWTNKLFVKTFPKFILGLAFIYIYCEYLIYYVTQIQCGWPELNISKKSSGQDTRPVYVMVLADMHLPGSQNGHWLDKWRRGWQMHQAFKTAMTLHGPDAIFVLGDIFDEGKTSTKKELNEYIERFQHLFTVPDGTAMYVTVGNSDIGYHYGMNTYAEQQLGAKLGSDPVRLVSIRGNHFVLINSMAMEGDGCTICSKAVAEIDRISDLLKCTSGSELCRGIETLASYSRPIILQHLPLYRESDSICTEPDAAPLPQRNNLFIERKNCISKESTEYLVESLRPRAAFGAHTHHSCILRHSFKPTKHHEVEFIEYTVPSFSWKNRLDPKYYLLTVTPTEVRVSKCGLPHEWMMQVTAILMVIALVVYLRYFGATDNLFRYKHQSGKKV